MIRYLVGMLAVLGAGPAPAAENDLAARFGMREGVENASLSPDGTHLAYVRPLEGQAGALFIAATAADAPPPVAALVASGDPERLGGCHWISNRRLACRLFGVVKALDILPFNRWLAVDIDGKNIKMLGVRTNQNSRGMLLGDGSIIDWLPDGDNAVLMSRRYLPDDRTGSHIGSSVEGLGVDRIDTVTLAASPVERPARSAAEYISDGNGNVRIRGLTSVDAGGYDKGHTDYAYRRKGASQWEPLGRYDGVTGTGFNPYAVDPDKNVAYGFKKHEGRQALFSVALDGSLAETLVFARPDVDVDGLVRIGRRGRVVGASYATDIRRAVYFDPALARIAAALSRAVPDQPLIRFVDSSLDEQKLLIWAGSDNNPGVYYLHDRTTRELRILTATRPELVGIKLATVKSVTYPAADGTLVPAYLTLPPTGGTKGLPAIVLPHGGPSARDEWGFDWLSQYFAARGYAVLSPNFRGSSGYGDAWFAENGFKSWNVAIGDVRDAGRWLVKEGIADPARLAILGWSYGGYAALQSAVTDPALFKAVVAIAPVTDLASLKAENQYWSNYRLVSDFIGSGAHIRDGSPAVHADRIKAPVLMFHGGLDRNVGIAQSRLMAGRLEAAGVPHELVTFDKLDHYLEDSVVRAAMLRKIEGFLGTAGVK